MSRTRTIAVTVMMFLLMALGANASQAATWRLSTTSSSLSATGPALRFVTAGATATCATSGLVLSGPAAGTYTGPASTGAWNHVASPATAYQITLRCGMARIVATPYTVKCNADEPTPTAGAYLNATSTSAMSQFDTVGLTNVNLSSLDCNFYVGNGTTNFCTKITSTGANVASATDRVGVSGTYRNPSSVTTGGTLTIRATSQTLTSNTTDPGTGRPSGCVVGNGDLRVSNSTGGDIAFAVDPSMSIWAG